MASNDVRTIVVGAGIAGLAAATEAAQFGDVLVLEASDRVGGTIRSERFDGYLVEHGAASMALPASGTSSLVTTSGVSQHLVTANPAAKRRWVQLPEGLVELPASPSAFLKSDLISKWAKFGILGELWTKPLSEDREESVSDFFARRFGAEIAGKLAQPMVSGIFAGQASQLSIDAAFPLLREMESSGSVIRSAMRKRKMSKATGLPKPNLHSFQDGLEQLPQALADDLGDKLLLDTPVESVEKETDGWRVSAGEQSWTCDHLLLAVGPQIAAKLLGHLDADIIELLDGIQHAPVAVVNLGIDADLLKEYQGFGFLAHPASSVHSMGIVFDSIIFPNRAPEGKALVRALVGGALNPEFVDFSDEQLIGLAAHDLETALDLPEEPEVDWSLVSRAIPGIPQYNIGHKARMDRLSEITSELGGLDLIGWSYRGIGVNSAIDDAIRTVRKLG